MKSLITKSIYFLIQLFPFIAFAQRESFRLESYTTEEGLSHNYVNCITQDASGFI